MSKSSIATEIAAKILSGGRRTLAMWLRDILSKLNDEGYNQDDGFIIIKSIGNGHRIKFQVGDDCMLIQPGEDLDA